jgi:hypothetical protein
MMPTDCDMGRYLTEYHRLFHYWTTNSQANSIKPSTQHNPDENGYLTLSLESLTTRNRCHAEILLCYHAELFFSFIPHSLFSLSSVCSRIGKSMTALVDDASTTVSLGVAIFS